MIKTKNKYKRSIENGIIFIMLIFIFDKVLGSTLRYFYFKSEYGAIYHLNYSLDSTEADIIILGSSRAHEHYVPDIIEDSLGLTCFNTGMDGNYLLNTYAVFKSIINRYTPRIILMDINLGELFIGSGGYDELSSLLPLYKNKKEVRNVILLKGKFERLKLISEIYPFNSTFLAIVEGNIRTEDIAKLKGYLPLFGSLNDTSFKHKQEVNKGMDINKIKALDAIADECETRGIRLIFVQSPRYEGVNQETSISVLKELAVNHNAEFWNFINNTMFLKPEYFKDGAHMNDFGAQEFTKTIASRIKREIFYGVNNFKEHFN